MNALRWLGKRRQVHVIELKKPDKISKDPLTELFRGVPECLKQKVKKIFKSPLNPLFSGGKFA